MKKIYYILLSFLYFPLIASAQIEHNDSTVSRTVVVEQEYNPIIQDASKITILPAVEELTAPKHEVAYDYSMIPARRLLPVAMRPLFAPEYEQQVKPGYLRLGYGNYNNLDVVANYLFRISTVDKLNVHFTMDGMSGKIKGDENSPYKWDSHFFNSKAGVSYLHQFEKLDFIAGVDYGLVNFNYFPQYASFSKQKFQSAGVKLGVESNEKSGRFQYLWNTSVLFYGRDQDVIDQNLKENIIRSVGEIKTAIGSEQSIAIGLAMDNYLYNHDSLKNFTALGLKPHYLYESDEWKIRLGAQVDFGFGFGKKAHFAPDVAINYIFADRYSFFGTVKGGRIANDFRALQEFNPYMNLTNERPQDSFEKINGQLGFKASPLNGVWFKIYGGHQRISDDLYVWNELISSEELRYHKLFQTNTNNTYLGADLTYEYQDVVGLSLNTVYRKWKADDELALFNKPTLSLDFSMKYSPLMNLTGFLGFLYEKRDEVEILPAVGDGFKDKMEPVSNLYAGLSYNLFKGINIYARANNLLNKKYQYYLNYPTEGISILGGMSFTF